MTHSHSLAGDQERIVMLRLNFKPGTVETVLREVAPIVRLTREETGNVDFQVFRATEEQDQLVLFERWTNQAALDHHWELDYTKRALALFDQHLIRPLSPAEDVTYLRDVMRAA